MTRGGERRVRVAGEEAAAGRARASAAPGGARDGPPPGLRRPQARASCPAASASASRSRARSSTGRACCCSTSRSARSTSSCGSRCRSSSRAIQREVGITFVYVTHDQEEALTMSEPRRRHERGPHRAGRRAGRGLRAPRQTAFVAGFVGVSNLLERDGAQLHGPAREGPRSSSRTRSATGCTPSAAASATSPTPG